MKIYLLNDFLLKSLMKRCPKIFPRANIPQPVKGHIDRKERRDTVEKGFQEETCGGNQHNDDVGKFSYRKVEYDDEKQRKQKPQGNIDEEVVRLCVEMKNIENAKPVEIR